jgi:hypothetical protein
MCDDECSGAEHGTRCRAGAIDQHRLGLLTDDELLAIIGVSLDDTSTAARVLVEHAQLEREQRPAVAAVYRAAYALLTGDGRVLDDDDPLGHVYLAIRAHGFSTGRR